MKLAAKILKIASIIFVSVLVLLFSLSLIMQNKVAGILLKTLNNNFSTKIETGSYRLSLIRKFPKASIELKNVLVHSSPDFDRAAFGGIKTDTLLAAKSASIDFRSIDMLRGTYTFTKISVRSGKLNLYTDTSGHYNYDISKNDDKTDGADNVKLNLNRINLSDIGFVYNDRRVDLIIGGIFKDGQLRSKIRGNNIDFSGKSKVNFELFRLGSFSIRQSIAAELEVGLNQNEKGTFFKKSTMRIENWDFVLTGFVAADNYLDLNVAADNIDISKITRFLPEKYSKAASAYHPSGILKFNWTIKGKPTKTEDPHYDIAFSLKNAHIDNSGSDLKIDRFSFDGAYTNGAKNRPLTSSFSVTNFTTRLGSADYTGSFSVSDFTNPRTEFVFKGKLIPAELREFLNLKNVSSAGGTIDLNLRFSGRPGKKDSYRFSDVFNLDSKSEVIFHSVGLSLENRQLDIRDATGSFVINESATTDNFRLTLNKQKISFSGKFVNFPGWLSGNPVNLLGTATISASSFRPELFMNTPEENSKKTISTGGKAPLSLTDDINLDVNFRVDTLVYRTFDARNISGTLSVKPKMLNFRTFSMNSQKGRVSGNGLVVQNRDKSFIGRGSFAVSGVDVNESFVTFHNFGQDFLKAENLAGTLSGNITLILPADSLLNPDIRAIVAEGKYVLTDGALIDFDPVKALSSFIELSELENIKFDRLENDFFIRNNTFYLPQMDIKSSAADLSVNGEHSFDNEYQYHVKILLSEILSKKARKNRTVSDEFGEVQDDGLGRTSLLLKIVGKGEEVKVSYDMKAAGTRIREEIKKEKQTLKTIINEEYGLYKKDSEPEQKKSLRPRFRITWEGSDTTSAVKEPPVQRKERLLDRLFKRK
ncbi:MAG TPA: hypothetical protein DCZ51_02110 [Bacteroidales bacterium]|nr:hypothetical protein [Bacteroidales bacterium]